MAAFGNLTMLLGYLLDCQTVTNPPVRAQEPIRPQQKLLAT